MSRSEASEVEVHVDGLTSQEEADALEQRLQARDGVEVRKAEQTRLILAYNPEAVTATELQELIEAAGGEVVTMDPRGANAGRKTGGEADVEHYQYHYVARSSSDVGWFYVDSLKEAKEQGQRDLEEGGDKRPLRITDDLGHVLAEWTYDPDTSTYELVEQADRSA